MKAKTVSQASSTAPTSVEEQIRQRAYELYEQRGRAEGHAEQDWLTAEQQILGRDNKVEAA